MSLKSFGLFFAGFFAVVLLASFASAATLSTWNLTVDNLGSAGPGITAGVLTSGLGVTLNPNPTNDLTNGATATGWSTAGLDNTDYYQVTLTPNLGVNTVVTSLSFSHITSNNAIPIMNFNVNWSKDNFVTSNNLVVGGVSTTISALSSTSTNINLNSGETLTLRVFGYNADAGESFSIKNLVVSGDFVPAEVAQCSTTANPGQLKIRSIDFANNGMQYKTFGSDDEWFPLEEIEVEMEVENNHPTLDVDDISVEWGLWDTQKSQWVIDLDEEDEINLKDGDSETLTVTFKIDDDLDVDLDDLSDGSNYRLYVVATGTVDGSVGIVLNPKTCVSGFEQTSVIIESDFVVLDNIVVPEVVQCGDPVLVTADVWNIGGDRDQDEVSVELTGREAALKLSQTVDVGDLDAFDKQLMSLTFTLPKNLEAKNYALVFQVHDDDGDVYENDFDDDPSEFTIPLKVECGAEKDPITISAVLESEAKAGTDLVVRVTITNNENELKTYTVGAAEFASWADSASADQTTLALNAGESKNVTFTFDVRKDASGAQTFFAEVVSGSEVTRQPVSVSIEPRSGLGFLGNAFSGDNSLVWLIGALNVILVIVIIVVAVRIARK